MTDDEVRDQFDNLNQRLDRLERFFGVADWQPTPGFDPARFQRILLSYFIPLYLVFFLPLILGLPLATTIQGRVADETLFGLPLWNIGGQPSVLGLPVGIISLGGGALGFVSFGGLAIGAIACGGGAIGIIAVGGGALGVIAFGGGAVGVIAFGGGACGYIAIGGGAYGTYVLAGDGKGKYVFDRRRQDDEAVRFFCRIFPRLRRAFTEETAGV